jgi:PAS domain S-box-containing protein
MSDPPSTAHRPFCYEPEKTSVEVDGRRNPLGIGFDSRGEEQVFELPARLFEQLPFAVYVCDRDGLVLRYNHRAAELWGRTPKLGDPNERFCGSYRMFRPDGHLLPHHECPMADVLRTGVSVRQQEIHIERPDGSRGIALVDIEAIKDGDEAIVGAVNCFQDITERKQKDKQIATLAREVEHRARNFLALVQATVHLSHSDTAAGLKKIIEGRIEALANAHDLFEQSQWTGADLRKLITNELLPYCQDGNGRLTIEGQDLSLEPSVAQMIAIAMHELTTNAVKYGALSAAGGRLEIAWSGVYDGRLLLRWAETGGPPVETPTRRGFGTGVIERVVRDQLKGEIKHQWRPEGLVCELNLPL